MELNHKRGWIKLRSKDEMYFKTVTTIMPRKEVPHIPI